MRPHCRVLLVGLLVFAVALPVTHPARTPYTTTIPVLDMTLSSDGGINITALWEEVWEGMSVDGLVQKTRELSEGYPGRLWNTFNMTPSEQLAAAYTWANSTLSAATGGEVVFHQATDFGVLYAVKQGTLEEPRPAFIISGVLDSDDSPGANDVAVSAAAVLEAAAALNAHALPFDVYYVLSTAGRTSPEDDPAAQAFVDWLITGGVNVFMTVSFDRLLFHRSGYPGGTQVALRTQTSSDYQRGEWAADLMVVAAETMGKGRLYRVPDLGVADVSLAREMWRRGLPAVHIAQGYFPDQYSGTGQDTWDNADYNFNKALEAVASAVCLTVYLGAVGSGSTAHHYRTARLTAGSETLLPTVVSYRWYFNVTATWTGPGTVGGEIVRASDSETVYYRTSSSGVLVMKYLVQSPGVFVVHIQNTGTTNITVQIVDTYLSDCDGDTLSDTQEKRLGLDTFNTDTDDDQLSDDLELALGSDPKNNDTDDDGATDYEEYVSGSNPVCNDTDGDGLLDGLEAALGTNPKSSDTDGDSLDDYDEVMVYHTDPRLADTDYDGVSDSLEVSMGMDPRSSDSDGDSLTDLFELLNGLDPTSNDTDHDGWGDAYEVESCMRPDSADTDGDWIPDGIDWDPRVHWLAMLAPVTVLTLASLMGIFSLLKYRHYRRLEQSRES